MNYDNWKLETPPTFDDDITYCHECKEENKTNMKQTAVEWLVEQCPRIETVLAYNILEQAKEMEKQQIIDAFGDSRILSITNNCNSGEQYYNETFKQE